MPKTFSKKRITSFEERVYDAVKKIPRGKVAIYAAVAKAIGNPRGSRAVGNALNKNPFRDVPCHRVVRSDGSAGGYAKGRLKKIKILRREGVVIRNDKVAAEFVLDKV